MKQLFTLVLFTASCLNLLSAVAAEEPVSIEQATADSQRFDGYFTFYYSAVEGTILLEIDRWDQEFLYANSLATGVGSNDLRLDRGQMGSGRVVKFERHGNKVFLKHINLQYRAQSDNALERLAVEEAFAESILWGFTVAAADDDRVLVDVTDFLLDDAHGIANTLAAQEQGNYSVDKTRSAIYMPRTRNFPLNTEFEAQLTFTSSP